MFYAPIPSGALRVTGSDRVPFVHGQVSNDVRGLPVPGGCRAVILNAKGQIEFDVRIYRRADDLYIQTDGDLESAVYERLKRYIVFDDVQLEDITAKISASHVSADLVQKLGFTPDGADVQLLEGDFGTLLAARVERGLAGGVDVHVLRSRADALGTFFQTHAEPLNVTDLERARLRAGLPDAHRDGFLERLPQECGLEPAVSYRKGCYIGQEIMARLEARGNTRYALQSVMLERPVSVGAAVTLEGKTVGQVGSSIVDGESVIGLAVLRRDLEPEVSLFVDDVRLEAALNPSTLTR
ncbi:MAG: folate-binding protein YgfZ [Pleurocapsa sp. SU_196_0]|nr:folate-binding protein YgfZ [Pleurocapsa sp. SU_196_0]